MMEQWEEFTGGPPEARGARMHVSLNHKGQFLLNKVVLEALGTPAAVVFLYERRNSRIGIRAANPTLKNAFPLKSRRKERSAMVFASTFCRNYGIKVTGTIGFTNIEFDREGMMVLDLDKTTRVSRVGDGPGDITGKVPLPKAISSHTV